MLLALAGLAGRATHLTVVDDRGAQRGEAQTRQWLTLPPERGTIVDRTGAEFAISVRAPSVYAVSSQIEDIPGTAHKLASILARNASALETEKALIDETRELTAQVRRLRDPARLAQLAIESGLGRPERVIDLRFDTRWRETP